MGRNLQTNKEEINVLVYTSYNEIYFVASSVIRQGLLTIREPDESIVYQKAILNSNYEHITLPIEIKKVIVYILSDEINYEKTLML